MCRIKFQTVSFLLISALLPQVGCSYEKSKKSPRQVVSPAICMVSVDVGERVEKNIMHDKSQFDEFLFDLSCKFSMPETGLMANDRPFVSGYRSLYLPSSQTCPAFQKKVQTYIEENYQLFGLEYNAMTVEDYFIELLEFNKSVSSFPEENNDRTSDIDLNKATEADIKTVTVDLPMTYNRCPKK